MINGSMTIKNILYRIMCITFKHHIQVHKLFQVMYLRNLAAFMCNTFRPL